MTSTVFPPLLGHALIVGFNPVEIDSLTQCIGQQGFSITVGDIRKLPFSSLDKYGLIILSISDDLPGGITVIEKIRQHNKGSFIPVLVLTSNICNDFIVEALNAGADDCIFMPYSERELVARIRSITRYLYRG